MELRSSATMSSVGCGEQFLLLFSAGQCYVCAQGGPDFRCSLSTFASRGRVWKCGVWLLAAEVAKFLPQVGRIWLEWELKREAFLFTHPLLLRGCWFDPALWSEIKQEWYFCPVLHEPARACESSLISESLVDHSELSDPRCQAALIVYGAMHPLPGEKEPCVPAGGLNAWGSESWGCWSH